MLFLFISSLNILFVLGRRWVAQGSQRARDNSIQCNLKLNNVLMRKMVCMVPFMKHSISFSFKNVNPISVDIISMKENHKKACVFEICIKRSNLKSDHSRTGIGVVPDRH